ncbi:MAG: hypothetical protein QXY98_04710 [Thermoplasmata archaeon]
MAKKRKKTKPQEEEKYEFVPPEFDEKQFLIDEMNATKRTLLVVGYGIAFGVVAGMATLTTNLAYLGLLVLLLGFATLKYFLSGVRVDISKFTRRNWIESGFWFFLTFLAIWVLVVNPPFMDIAPPDITHVSIAVHTSAGTWITYNYSYNASHGSYQWVGPSGAPSVQSSLRAAYDNGYAVNVSARVADNGALSGPPSIQFRLSPAGNEITNSMSPTDRTYIYSFVIDAFGPSYLTGGYFTFRIIAQDASGHSATFNLAQNAEILVA